MGLPDLVATAAGPEEGEDRDATAVDAHPDWTYSPAAARSTHPFNSVIAPSSTVTTMSITREPTWTVRHLASSASACSRTPTSPARSASKAR